MITAAITSLSGNRLDQLSTARKIDQAQEDIAGEISQKVLERERKMGSLLLYATKNLEVEFGEREPEIISLLNQTVFTSGVGKKSSKIRIADILERLIDSIQVITDQVHLRLKDAMDGSTETSTTLRDNSIDILGRGARY